VAFKELNVRIIAGAAKGRTLIVPATGTRPMTGRARESVFSILARRLVDARVLDLYAGSGSLGLESLSRGAKAATFVERNDEAVRIIEDNIESVGLGGNVVQGSLPGVFTRLRCEFDIVFLDPPYGDSDRDVSAVLAGLASLLAPAGLVVLHRQAASRPMLPEFLTSVDERRYGDAVVTMMEKATS